MLLYVLIVGVWLSAVQGQDCNWIKSLDCSSYAYKPLCGTDYKTYGTRCAFAKVHCADTSINILAEMTCTAAGFTTRKTTPLTTRKTTPMTTRIQTTGKPTTAMPTVPTTTHKPVFLGHDLVFDFFCLELSHEQCPADTEPVCGSDGKLYSSFCEFEKHRCSHRNLTVVQFNAC